MHCWISNNWMQIGCKDALKALFKDYRRIICSPRSLSPFVDLTTAQMDRIFSNRELIALISQTEYVISVRIYVFRVFHIFCRTNAKQSGRLLAFTLRIELPNYLKEKKEKNKKQAKNIFLFSTHFSVFRFCFLFLLLFFTKSLPAQCWFLEQIIH